MERYARQQPALFLGGAFVLGLLGARFLKSTAQREDDSEGGGYGGDRGYGSTGTTGTIADRATTPTGRAITRGRIVGSTIAATRVADTAASTRVERQPEDMVARPGYAGGATTGEYGGQHTGGATTGSGPAVRTSTGERSWTVRGTETQ